jgi:hypothetical protein
MIEKLIQKYDDSGLGIEVKWEQVEEQFRESPLFKDSEPLDQIMAFEEYTKTLERRDF